MRAATSGQATCATLARGRGNLIRLQLEQQAERRAGWLLVGLLLIWLLAGAWSLHQRAIAAEAERDRHKQEVERLARDAERLAAQWRTGQSVALLLGTLSITIGTRLWGNRQRRQDSLPEITLPSSPLAGA